MQSVRIHVPRFLKNLNQSLAVRECSSKLGPVYKSDLHDDHIYNTMFKFINILKLKLLKNLVYALQFY